jgi:hypothetical protein
MSEDFGGVFDEPMWADSSTFEEVFLMWRAKPDLGLVVVPQRGSAEPRVIFCNLSSGKEAMFTDRLDHPEASMTLSEARAALDFVEATWTRRKGPIDPS